MSFASGSQRGIRYVVESVWNTTPGTPSMKILRTTTDTLGMRRQNNQSAELRSDRQISDFRPGNAQVGGDLGFELSFGAQDDLLESALFGAFAVAYNVTGASITVAATPKTFTRAAGNFLTDGVLVGDKITFSGFTNPGNNGTFVVSNVTETVVTCSTATGLVDEAGGGDEAFTTTRKRALVGTTLKSMTIEKAHLDVAKYLLFTGMAASTFRLSIQPERIVSGTFGMVGGSMSLEDAPLDASPDAAPTASPFDSFTGSIKEGGSAIAIATGLELALDNGLEARFALMDRNAKLLVDKRSNLTGTLTAYFEDGTLLGKFVDETESSLEITVTDLAAQSYRFIVPRIKYTGGDLPVNAEGPLTLSLPFQALLDSTYGTNLVVDRIA